MNYSAEQLIDLALKQGASHAEVYQSRSLSHPVFFETNRLKQLESSQTAGTALRLWRDGCPGLAVMYGDVDPLILVEKAIALSHLTEPEVIDWVQPRTAIYPNIGESISVETLITLGKEAIAGIRQKYPDVICSSEWECEAETTTLLNSQGLHCEYSETSLSYYLGVEWIRGEDFLGIYEGDYTREQPTVDRVIKSLLQRLQWAQTNVKSPKGKIPVLLTPNASTVLWGVVAEALNGKRVLDQSSPWSEKLGQTVIAQGLTLSQQPDKDPYTCPFDDEGTPTQPLTLITDGQLQQVYSDRTTARKLGLLPTGNGFRSGLGRYPSPSLVNLVVESGSHSFSELITQLDDGLIVDQLLGEGAEISGDFSVNVDLGYRVQKGQITGRVKDTMIAGNVYNILKNTVILGNDARWNGSCYTPSLMVQGLSVVSG